jgi:hypothetical protein
MRYKALPIVIVGLTAALTWAAVEFLPASLHFPVVEYSTPENVQITMYKNGELDQSSCKDSVGKIANSIRANCPACKVIEHCFLGLDAEHRRVLARDPLTTPSARWPGGKLMMTISAADPQMAMAVCQQMEQQTASQTVDKRLKCFPALSSR